MISIVKKKNKIKRELLSKIEWACSLNAIKLEHEMILEGCLRIIEHTNLAYVEPHRVIIKDKLFLFFNECDYFYVGDLRYKYSLSQFNIIADGWYNPPPNGMAILFGNRVSFDSLRNERNWASDTIINWKEDLLYAYCSPVDKVSGIIGDISITLYFGKDKEIIKHIKNCYNAILEVFDLLDKVKDSRELFIASEKIFTNYKLKNCIVSKTDNTPLDLGHTFPKLENLQAKESLTEIEKQKISKARKFINAYSNWEFEEGMQFTIEPQLISTINAKLPQISQHYLVKKENGKFIICKDIDEILEKYKLINE